MEMMLPFFATLICVIFSLQNRVQATDSLFVQTATGVTLNGTLTLTGIADKTTYFADRPVRDAGIMTTEDFLELFQTNSTSVRYAFGYCIRVISLSLSLTGIDVCERIHACTHHHHHHHHHPAESVGIRVCRCRRHIILCRTRRPQQRHLVPNSIRCQALRNAQRPRRTPLSTHNCRSRCRIQIAV